MRAQANRLAFAQTSTVLLHSNQARWEALRKDKEDVQCQLEERIFSLHRLAHQSEDNFKMGLEETKQAATAKAGEMAWRTAEAGTLSSNASLNSPNE